MGALIVFGYGPGISHATAERFGREGYSLALVGRNAERLAEGASRLKASGFDARAYQSDAADLAMIRQTVTRSGMIWDLSQLFSGPLSEAAA